MNSALVVFCSNTGAVRPLSQKKNSHLCKVASLGFDFLPTTIYRDSLHRFRSAEVQSVLVVSRCVWFLRCSWRLIISIKSYFTSHECGNLLSSLGMEIPASLLARGQGCQVSLLTRRFLCSIPWWWWRWAVIWTWMYSFSAGNLFFFLVKRKRVLCDI